MIENLAFWKVAKFRDPRPNFKGQGHLKTYKNTDFRPYLWNYLTDVHQNMHRRGKW